MSDQPLTSNNEWYDLDGPTSGDVLGRAGGQAYKLLKRIALAAAFSLVTVMLYLVRRYVVSK
jgi:hypothetical protein